MNNAFLLRAVPESHCKMYCPGIAATQVPVLEKTFVSPDNFPLLKCSDSVFRAWLLAVLVRNVFNCEQENSASECPSEHEFQRQVAPGVTPAASMSRAKAAAVCLSQWRAEGAHKPVNTLSVFLSCPSMYSLPRGTCRPRCPGELAGWTPQSHVCNVLQHALGGKPNACR